VKKKRQVGGIETSYRDTTCGELAGEDAGRAVRLCGWVCRRRDHGGLIFVDLRDRYGVTQVVIDPSSIPEEEIARGVRLEYVIQVVRHRGTSTRRHGEPVSRYRGDRGPLLESHTSGEVQSDAVSDRGTHRGLGGYQALV